MDDQLTPETIRRLQELLPDRGSLANSWRGVWADEDLDKARLYQARQLVKKGWRFASTLGRFVKGEGRHKIEARPTSLMRSKSGDTDFNPLRDAFALRLGAVFVRDNVYRLGDLYL